MEDKYIEVTIERTLKNGDNVMIFGSPLPSTEHLVLNKYNTNYIALNLVILVFSNILAIGLLTYLTIVQVKWKVLMRASHTMK